MLLLINVLFFSGKSLAFYNENISFSGDCLTKDYKQLNLKEVGSAPFSVLFWDIYNSILYTESGKYSPENLSDTVIFEIEYYRDITSKDLLERTIEQWQYLDVPENHYKPFVPLLQEIWPDIAAGDKLTMVVHHHQSIFYFNGEKIGLIKQKEFSRLFLDIWLSPNTSEKKLRAQLLGGIQ